MTTHLFKLHFAGGLHIADGGFAEEKSGATIRSDTLLSALAWAARLLYGDGGGAKILQPGAVVVSSAFPFVGERLFFPKPLSWMPDLPTDQRKQWKKIRFVEDKILWNNLATNMPEVEIQNNVVQTCLFAAPLPAEKPDIFTQLERQRIAVDRLNATTSLYNIAEVYFGQGAGLFFLARFADTDTERIARAALRLLGDEGIGADRTVGKGLFHVDESTFDTLNGQNLPPQSNAHLLLSLYSPTREELEDFLPEQSYYTITTRGGWASGTDLRRKSLRMLGEGSVLHFRNGVKPQGSLPVVLAQENLQSDFSLVRNAQAFVMPVFEQKGATV